MFWTCAQLTLLTILGCTTADQTVRGKALLEHDWAEAFKVIITVDMQYPVPNGWRMALIFTNPIKRIDVWRAKVIATSTDRLIYTLKNMDFNPSLQKGEKITLAVVAYKVKLHSSPGKVSVLFRGGHVAPTHLPPSSNPTTKPVSSLPPGPSTETTDTSPVTTSGPVSSHTSETSTTYTEEASLGPSTGPSGNTVTRSTGPLTVTSESTWPTKQPTSGPLTGSTSGNTSEPSTVPTSGSPTSPTSGVPPHSTIEPPPVPTSGSPTSPTSGVPPHSTMEPPPVPTSESQTSPTSGVPPHSTMEPPPVPTSTGTSTGSTSGITSEPPPVPTSGSPTSPTSGIPPHSTIEPPPVPTSTGTPTCPPPQPRPKIRHNYNELLHKSILFYEAQRSGKLPSSNRVPWRKDSALYDRGENGEDLTGGWYDGGDHVKFGFPMAFSTTVLAWGLLEFRGAYKAAGELENMLDSIKWPLEYFIKAHTKPLEFYGQVGDGQADHASWGRPEDMSLPRPSYRIDPSNPGSDLAAETAAAMAAGAVVFRQTDPLFAETLLRHAEELYTLADTHRGKYSDSITNADYFYPSTDFKDELAWGAAWLYRATSNKKYLNMAVKVYNEFDLCKRPRSFDWDDKTAGVQLLLAKMTGNSSYSSDFQTFLDDWLPCGDVIYTAKGLAWSHRNGPNRYSASTAFLALMAADMRLKPADDREFATQQINYLLGDQGRSFVVGYGENYPRRPRHRASSCPLSPVPCGWDNYKEAGPNPQILHGALVGGPDRNDFYNDDRNDDVMNRVATDYNAGFQSALAGLKHLQLSGLV